MGSVLFYARDLEWKKAARGSAKGPVAFVLDDQRLAPTSGDPAQFDNRYTVTLPSAEDLLRLGMKRVLYVTDVEMADEQDDLNDFVVAYQEAGISVGMLAMSSFQKDRDYLPVEGVKDPTNGYYYGGSHESHTYFYHHYPFFIWFPMPLYGWTAPAAARPPASVRPPAYKPRPRPTMFASQKTGMTKGVGRTKPTGFGRTSTRSGGWLGRSGSLGRFRSSSSSFGG
jgi:hypothetical protein